MAINDTNNTIPAEHRLAGARNFAQRNEKVRDFNTAEEEQILVVAKTDEEVPTAVQTALDLKQNLNAKLTTYVGLKNYRALLTQTGTAAPSIVLLQNDLSDVIVWTRADVGVYAGTLTGAFPAGKLCILISTHSATFAGCVRVSANGLALLTYDVTGAAADAILTNASISITVYP